MNELQLFGAKQSTYLRVAWMTCEEKGAAYTIHPGMPHTPEILAMHPFGRIPVMRHGVLTLFESKAIATYVDRLFPGPRLIPEPASEQALVEQWVSAINTSIAPAWTTYFRAHVFPTGPGGKPDAAAVAAQLPVIAEHIEVLRRAVSETGYLVGEAFTLADIAVLPILHYLHQFPEGAELAARCTELEAYYERIASRPSAIATVPPPMSELT